MAAAGDQLLPVTDTPLASLRKRLEAKRPIPLASTTDQQADTLSTGGAYTESGTLVPNSHEAGDSLLDGRYHSHAGDHDDIRLVDLVTYDHCSEAVQMPAAVEQQVLLQFAPAIDVLGRALPSAARHTAESTGRLPQEEVGLYMAPRPIINHQSLHKLEARLYKGARLDVKRMLEQMPQSIATPAGGASSPQRNAGFALSPVREEAAVAASADTGRGGPASTSRSRAAGPRWLDQDGLMVYQPNPIKPEMERPWRRYDEDDLALHFSRPLLHSINMSDASRTFRLDVELGRLEFACHPMMTREHQLAAKLTTMFREYKRRSSAGLGPFYAHRLAALEDALLRSREDLFQAVEQALPADQAQALLISTASLEREVAEVRQLRQEEEALLHSTIAAMDKIWQELVECRSRQGVARTEVAFSVVQLPDEDTTPNQQDGLSRRQLDIALLVAEQDQVSGLPAFPAALPLSRADGELTGFVLRRVETTCSAHALAVAEVQDRLALLRDRVSADPNDPEIVALEQQLAALGPVPRRLAKPHVEELQLRTEAEAAVACGHVGVPRAPKLEATLSLMTPAATMPYNQQQQLQQMDGMGAAVGHNRSSAGGGWGAAPGDGAFAGQGQWAGGPGPGSAGG